jgi:hypothetical protein
MRKTYYHNFSFKELADVYTTTKANYGKIDGELLAEINARGGEEVFQLQLASSQQIHKEKQRIIQETNQLTSAETNVELIKQLVKSDILSKAELEDTIEKAFANSRWYDENKRITLKTVTGCIIGMTCGIILGNGLLFAEIYFLQAIYYFSLVIIYGITFYITRMITKQTASNLLVFISCLVAPIAAMIIFFQLTGL